MRYKKYIGVLLYRVIGTYPDKKLQPIGMCVERKTTPNQPYLWCEFTPSHLNELITIPIDPEETHNATIQTQPCTTDEIENIFSDIFFDGYVSDLPISEVTQSTEEGYYFDLKPD